MDMKKARQKRTGSQNTRRTVSSPDTPTPRSTDFGSKRRSPSPSKPKVKRKNSTTASEAVSMRKTAVEAGRNLLEALGGRDSVMELLADSTHPKAQLLVDRMNSLEHNSENFSTSYTSVGLKTVDMVQIFADRQKARTFITAVSESDSVMRALIRRAKDSFDPCPKCGETGWKLDPKTGLETDVECRNCYGTGKVMKSGEHDAQDLYFTLIDWKKSGGGVMIDNRKQVVQMSGQQITTPAGTLPGQAPDVQSIIKRADQCLLPAVAQTTTESESYSMPEDEGVMEPELVEG